jgi:hypothetical protein
MCDAGAIGRRSRSIDTENKYTNENPMATPAMAVFRFQCLGSHHHPPYGVQTFFGKEEEERKKERENVNARYKQKEKRKMSIDIFVCKHNTRRRCSTHTHNIFAFIPTTPYLWNVIPSTSSHG